MAVNTTDVKREMDPLVRAANVEGCAVRWAADATRYTGRRRAWREARAARLRTLADAIVEQGIAEDSR